MTEPCTECGGPWRPQVVEGKSRDVWIDGTWQRGERVQDPLYMDAGVCFDCRIVGARARKIKGMPDWIDRARALLSDHHNMEETAAALGIHRETLRRWKHCL